MGGEGACGEVCWDAFYLGGVFRGDLGGGLEGNFRLADVLYWRSWRILYGALGLCASAAFLKNQIPNVQIYWSRMIVFHTCKAICLQIELER